MDGRDAGDLRHRTANINLNEDEKKLTKQQTFDGVDSDDDKPFGDDAIPDLSHRLPQASDKTTEILDQALSGLPSRFVYILLFFFSSFLLTNHFVSYSLRNDRWKNYIIRTLFTFVMIAFFTGLIYLGPLALMVVVRIS